MSSVRVIFRNGTACNQKEQVEVLIKELKNRKESLHSIPINDLLDFFNSLSSFLSKTPILAKTGYSKNIVDFLNKSQLESSLNIALHGNLDALDKFVDLGSKKFLFHAQPRGLVVEWLAGNVPILGLFSIFSALLTKNVCLAKVSGKGHEELTQLLSLVKEVNTSKIRGADILNFLTLVLIDSDDQENHEALSLNADVRIAWGGEEAIKNITSLKKSPHTEDIIFGPKYSYALIDKESLESNKILIAQRLAVDVSTFDQYACSSPHTVFIEEGGKFSAKEFAAELAKQLELVNRALIPKNETDPGKAAEIIALRSEYSLTGQVWKSEGTEWTVLYSQERGLFRGCFSRVIMVKPIKNLEEIALYNDRGKQTLGVALTKENKIKYLDKITLNGIDRCPDLGTMTFFESPWDGMFFFDRLIRWVTISKQ